MCNLVLKIKIQLLKHAIKPSKGFNLNYPKPIHGFLIIRSPLSHRHQTIPKLGVYTLSLFFLSHTTQPTPLCIFPSLTYSPLFCVLFFQYYSLTSPIISAIFPFSDQERALSWYCLPQFTIYYIFFMQMPLRRIVQFASLWLTYGL